MLMERVLGAEKARPPGGPAQERASPGPGGPVRERRRNASVQARLMQLAEETPDFVVMIDVRGNVLYGNPAARRLLGIDRETKGIQIEDVHPTWANMLVLGVGIQTALLDGVWRGESALLNVDGEEVPVSEMILAHPDADGRCDYLSIVARDIGEIKQTENALAASEQFYRRIVESANAGMWIVDLDERVTFVNPRLARLLDFAVEEMIGRPVSEFLAEPIRPSAQEERACKLYRKDGTTIDARLSISPLFDQNEEHAGTLGVVVRG